MEKIFFQSSMPRALSTTLQNIIGQNPDFYVTPTSGVLELLFAASGNYTNSHEFKAQDSELMKQGFIGFCKGGLEGFFNAITEKKYVLDKSRGWGEYRGFLNSFYPEPKIICMVRDLKDVVASFEKIYRDNPLKRNPVKNDSTGQGATVHSRVDYYMAPNQPIGMAVSRLRNIIQQGYDNKILFVKAEDLCLRPETEMIRIYDYLEVPYFEHDFDNIQQITHEDDAVYGLSPSLHKIRSRLEMKPSDAHNILGKDVCKWLYDTFRWYYEKFGYKM